MRFRWVCPLCARVASVGQPRSPLPLLAIIGPTASGKSSLAVDVAVALGAEGVACEIISCDAMQLYRGMDIGTAKITPVEASGVPHHLLGVWSPSAEASVREYQRLAREAIEDCHRRGALAMLVGGSGLYFSSVAYRFEFPGHDQELRQRLEREFEEKGLEPLVSRLAEADAEAVGHIDLKNPRRVIRALEVIALSGQSPELALRARGELWYQPTVIWGLGWSREALIERIDQRVRGMFDQGLVAEVSHLLAGEEGLSHTARQAIGYREVIEYLEGKISLAEAEHAVASHTRRYARKQLSWFRRDSLIEWLEADSPDLSALLVSRIRAMLQRG